MSGSDPEFDNTHSPEEVVQFALQIDLMSRSEQLLQLPELADLTDRLASHYQITDNRTFKGILATARLAERRDSTMGIDRELPGTKAFAHGALLGVFMTRTLLGDDHGEIGNIIEAFYNAMVPDGATPEESAHTVMDKGGIGFRRAESAHGLIERAETLIFPDITQHVYFEHGFGYVIYLVTEYLIDKERARQEAEHAKAMGDIEALAQLTAAPDFDWHDLLK